MSATPEGTLDSVAALARPAVRRLVPYSSARNEAEGVESPELLLDANESPWAPELDAAAIEAGITASAAAIHRYPHPQPDALVTRFQAIHGVPRESLFIGRGTDDAIDALFRVFCDAGRDQVIVCPPTYGMYRVSADIQGAAVIEVPLIAEDGYRPDPDGIIAAAGGASGGSPDSITKLVFLCSPNNPTGNTVDREIIAALCRSLRAVVVVDEAYIEFCPERSALGLLADFANLVILRTLSKAWALAGARCGVAIGHRAVIELMHRVRAPYPLSQPAIALVAQALSPAGQEQCQARVQRIIAARDALAETLADRADVIRVFPSQANFLLIEVRDPGGWMAACRRVGVLIRDRSEVVPGCVRVTVGTPEQNQAFLRALPGDGPDTWRGATS